MPAVPGVSGPRALDVYGVRAKTPSSSSSRSRSRSRSTSRSTRPNTPSLSSINSRAISTYQEEVQKAYQNALKRMVPIPTFSASYFLPQDILKQIKQISKQSPKINTKQLMQVAQTTISLLTNPQIEALRSQINELKKLQPQMKEQINKNYSQAQTQVAQNTQNVIQQILQNIDQEGGLRSGVATAVMANAIQNVQPTVRVMEQNRKLDLNSVLGLLRTQQQNAQDLLRTIEKNKKNMTKAQYNALRDRAIQQWRQAQQQQLQFLNALADMETMARQSAANLAQQKALDTNELINQLLQNQLAALQSNQKNFLETYLPQLRQENLNRWMDYISSSRTAAEAMRRLQENRQAIIDSTGQEGFEQLYQYISKFEPDWVNPAYYTPPSVSTTSRSSSKSSKSTSSGSLVSNLLRNLVLSSPSLNFANLLTGLFK